MDRALRMVDQRSVLVLVDYQAKLMPAIHDADAVSQRAGLLAEAAHQCGVPVIGTEQNPDKLGPQLEPLSAACEQTMAKRHFGACEDGLLDAIPGRTDVIIGGCEAHVCLLQTALGLLEQGLTVFVVADACGSRYESDRQAALARLAAAGARVVTTEMVIFEWLNTCDHPRFRDGSALVKRPRVGD